MSERSTTLSAQAWLDGIYRSVLSFITAPALLTLVRARRATRQERALID